MPQATPARRENPLWTALAIVAPPLALLLASLFWFRPGRKGLARTLAYPALFMIGAVLLVLGLTTFITYLAA